jgi:CheY-like chemotaxis protein
MQLLQFEQSDAGYAKDTIVAMAHVGLLEDNARIAKLSATLLHYAGYHVTVFESSAQCLHALLAQHSSNGYETHGSADIGNPCNPQMPVDVLILDLFLPDIDGIDVLRYLTSHPHTAELPIILCTAATQSEVMKAQRIAPHVGVVEKPFKLQTLVSAITTALNSAPAAS